MSLKRRQAQKRRKRLSLDVLQAVGAPEDTTTREQRYARRAAKEEGQSIPEQRAAREQMRADLAGPAAPAYPPGFQTMPYIQNPGEPTPGPTPLPNAPVLSREELWKYLKPMPYVQSPDVAQALQPSQIPPERLRAFLEAFDRTAGAIDRGETAPSLSAALQPPAKAPAAPATAQGSNLASLPVEGTNPLPLLEARQQANLAAVSRQPLQGPAQAPTPEPESPVDALLRQALEQATAPQEQAAPGPLLSKGERLAAGILAALNPQAYAQMVQPELQRRMQERQMATAAEGKDEDRLLRAANIASTIEDREARRQATKDAASEKLRLHEEEQDGFGDRLEIVSEALNAALQPIQTEDGQQLENGISGAIRVLQGSGDPYDAAVAGGILNRVQQIATGLQRASAEGTVLSDDMVTRLEKQLEDLNDDLSAQLDKSRGAAASRANAAATAGAREASLALQKELAEQRRVGQERLAQVGDVDARTLAEEHGRSIAVSNLMRDMETMSGLFQRGTRYAIDETPEFKRFRDYWQLVRATFLTDTIGKAQTAQEARRIDGIMMNPGEIEYGDAESMRAALESMQYAVAQNYLSTITSLKDKGKTVGEQFTRWERDIVPRLAPAVALRVLPLPDDVPPGAFMVQYDPRWRVYEMPDGSRVPWSETLEGLAAAEAALSGQLVGEEQ